MAEHTTVVVEHDFLKDRWSEIDTLIRREFQESDFNDGFTVDRPFWHINKGIDGKLGKGIKHVLAIGSDDKIVAAAFCIPSYRSPEQDSCDIGWFLSSSTLSRIQKIKVLDDVFSKVHEVTRHAGFKQIVTNMGTQGGAKYLGKRQKYIHIPEGEKVNRWVKEL